MMTSQHVINHVTEEMGMISVQDCFSQRHLHDTKSFPIDSALSYIWKCCLIQLPTFSGLPALPFYLRGTNYFMGRWSNQLVTFPFSLCEDILFLKVLLNWRIFPKCYYVTSLFPLLMIISFLYCNHFHGNQLSCLSWAEDYEFQWEISQKRSENL